MARSAPVPSMNLIQVLCFEVLETCTQSTRFPRPVTVRKKPLKN